MAKNKSETSEAEVSEELEEEIIEDIEKSGVPESIAEKEEKIAEKIEKEIEKEASSEEVKVFYDKMGITPYTQDTLKSLPTSDLKKFLEEYKER